MNGTTLAVTFNTGLDPYTQYICFVTANTSAGEGSPSMIVTERTVEGGTLSFNWECAHSFEQICVVFMY